MPFCAAAQGVQEFHFCVHAGLTVDHTKLAHAAFWHHWLEYTPAWNYPFA